MPATQQERAAAFRSLHAGEPFVIPNPWDAGSARVMEELGFQALATTSSGFAFTLGRRDGQVTLDEVVTHVRALCGASGLPVSVDLENGFGPRALGTPPPSSAWPRPARWAAPSRTMPGMPASMSDGPAVERVSAAVEAARALDFPFTLTARAENQIRGNPDLADTIARLQAYEQAGADVLYAPGLRDAGDRSGRWPGPPRSR